MSLDRMPSPGPIVLFGSGETSPSGQKIFDELFHNLPSEPRCALLETPAGFELNSYQVIERVGDFLKERLQNYHPQIDIVRARKRNTADSPDNPATVDPLLRADMIFMGPGSPTYAVRQLRNSLAWYYLLARHALGAALVFASAAMVAVGTYALPVYEIFKVGEDPHWKDGLDFFGNYSISMVLIPHWNNQEGGASLDTSRCFMGRERFTRLATLLPPGLTIMGLDENTALYMDLQAGTGKVYGAGEVTWIHVGSEHLGSATAEFVHQAGLEEVIQARGGHVHRYCKGDSFPLSECCPMRLPVPGQGVPPKMWQRVLEVAQQVGSASPESPPEEVQRLVQERQEARSRKDWEAADDLRQRITDLGWTVEDTPQGPKVVKK